MLVAEKQDHQYALEQPVYKPSRQPKRNPKIKPSKQSEIKRITKVKCITFTILVFIAAITILFQHTKLNKTNTEIINLEKELNELHMLTDSVEGELLASVDLQKIETTAKNHLGMVEPNAQQMTPIKVSHSNGMKSDGNHSTPIPNQGKTVAFLSKILNYIN